jgi:hypothetical protein
MPAFLNVAGAFIKKEGTGSNKKRIKLFPVYFVSIVKQIYAG